MLILKSLELEGFGSFKEKTVIGFPEKGAILVAGKKANSSISSGTGKSTILKGIAFSFGYCDIPATELKNWNSKSLSVKLTVFDTETKETVVIIRDPKLSLIINDVPYVSTSVGAEEKLAQILKIHVDLVKTLTYRPQREFGTFLNSTDSDKKEFLSKLLNLTALEEVGDMHKKEYGEYLQRNMVLDSQISGIKSVLDSLVISQLEIEQAQHEVERLVAEEARIAAEVGQLSFSGEEVALLEQKKREINQVINEVAQWRFQVDRIKADATKINKEIDHLKNTCSCPTCMQKWDNFATQIDARKAELAALLEKYKAGTEFLTKNQGVGVELPAIEARIVELRAQMTNAQKPLYELRNALSTAKRYYDEVRSKDSLKKNKTSELHQLMTRKTENESNSEVSKHLAEIFSRSGFLSVIFDEVLADIEAKTNEMIAHIPNVECFTMGISSHSETKGGKLQKKINIRINKGTKEVSLKNLSGGQMCALELCTDLAISECIRQRLNSPFGWIALDEAMDGLDAETKRPTLDMLKSMLHGQIFVIDHSTEVKEGFESIILVNYDGNNSWVE